MHSNRWLQALLSFGFLWFVLAIAFAPANKIYQQGLVALVWLPTLVLAWPARTLIGEYWRGQRVMCVLLLLLMAWATISLSWSQADDLSREFKRTLYIAVFILFFPILAASCPERIIRLLQWSGAGMALAALVSLIQFFVIRHNPWFARAEGLGELSHPILGAYVIGVVAVWTLLLPPRGRLMQVAWAAGLLFSAAFVVMSQSRGAVLALVLTMVLLPVWWRDRRALMISAGFIIAALAGFWLMEALMMARGSSFRPEIFAAAIKMISLHPWGGLGLGSPYNVFVAEGLKFDHSHNLFTHTAIELGLPGMLLWAGIWLTVLWESWRARDTDLGRCLVGVWVFSTLAMQFDAASLTGSPRAEWFISWLPIGLACVLVWARAPRHAVVKSRVQFNQ
ncbi:O-antigen ligase family protein [Pseudomonas sp. NPDC090203]|uniref:O-antigen ligase family protein n=1 Tax=Pseudomonas sp. NPDC090203 TaxID=3364477 RepID=UPI0037F6462B